MQAAFFIIFFKDLLTYNEFTLRAYWFAIKRLAGTICLKVVCNPDESDDFLKGLNGFARYLIKVNYVCLKLHTYCLCQANI